MDPSDTTTTKPTRAVKDAIKEIISIQNKNMTGALSQSKVKDMMTWYLRRLGVDDAELSHLPPIVHVAGTKGKGSTCAFVEAVLRSLGLTTALYTSPHLVDIRERFRVDGQPMQMDDFLEKFWFTYDRLKETQDWENPNDFKTMPGYFYFLTLLALQMFSKDKVDVLILEVGIGGRLDATNVIQPAVCGISLLDLDHTDLLGDTIEAIAGEKAGILKPSVPSFTVTQPDSALAVIQSKAEQVNTTVQVVDPILKCDPSNQTPLVNTPVTTQAKRQAVAVDGVPVATNIVLPDFAVGPWITEDTRLGLAGDFQISNASLALALCKSLLASNPNNIVAKTGLDQDTLSKMTQAPGLHQMLSNPRVRAGLSQCRWPGRAQTVILPNQVAHGGGDLTFFLDGAHSPKSLKLCLEWFAEASQGFAKPSTKTKRVLLFNTSHSRDAGLFLSDIVANDMIDQAVFTVGTVRPSALQVPSVREILDKLNVTPHPDVKQVTIEPSSPTAWQATLAEVWRHIQTDETKRGSDVLVTGSVEEALEQLQHLDVEPGMDVHVLATGSLLLVGNVLDGLNWRPAQDGQKVVIA